MYTFQLDAITLLLAQYTALAACQICFNAKMNKTYYMYNISPQTPQYSESTILFKNDFSKST